MDTPSPRIPYHVTCHRCARLGIVAAHNHNHASERLLSLGWVLDEVVTLEPVPCRGSMKLWVVPAGVLDIVRERWLQARAQR